MELTLKLIDIKKKLSLNIGGLVFLFISVYLISELLLEGTILPLSISSVQDSMNHWLKHCHILIAGLIPIYVALVFFSAAIVGFLFGSVLQRWLAKFFLEE